MIFYPTNFGGGGSVTSVAFAGDGTVLSSTPTSPITTSGTLTASLNTQSANTVLAGPTSGPAAAPTFRAIVAADLPATVNVWSSLTAPTGNLTLATTTFNTTFTSTSATSWTWQNLTAASSGSPFQDSPALILLGHVWGPTMTPSNQTVSFSIQESGGQLKFTQNSTISSVFPYTFDGNVLIPEMIQCGVFQCAFGTGGSGGVYPFTSVANASAGKTTYTGTVPGGSSIVAGQYITITGWTNAVNNGRFIIFSFTTGVGTGTITVYNASGVAEVHAASGTVDSGYGNIGQLAFQSGLTTAFHIEGNSYPANSAFSTVPGYPLFVFTLDGDATDAAYMRIISDGSTGNHFLEIGSIVDGTGTTPVTIQAGVLGGVDQINFSHQISAPQLNMPSVKKNTVKVNVTSTQLKALPGSPISLVAAPGANQLLVVDSVVFQYRFGTTPYHIANGDNTGVLVYHGETQGAGFIVTNTGFFDQSVNEIAWFTWTQATGGASGGQLPQSQCLNLGIDFTLAGTTPGLTLGDGTLEIVLEYSTIDLS